MRWRWPPENSCGYLSASVARRPTASSASATRVRASAAGITASGSATMRPTRWRGSSEPYGILEHHLEVAPRRDQLVGRQRVQVAAEQLHAARGRRFERHHQPRQRRFARARFADDAQAAAGLHREADAAQRLDDRCRLEQAFARQVVVLEVAHVEQPLPGDPRRMQRALVRPTRTAGGGAARQASMTQPQRSANGQPAGMSTSSGTRPGIVASRVPRARAEPRPGAEQAARVRMRQVPKTAGGRPRFDDACRRTSPASARPARHHAEVVADQQQRHAALVDELADQVEDLAAGSSRRARSSARRRSAGRGRRRAPSRSSRAGAGRRKAGADRRRGARAAFGRRTRSSRRKASARAAARAMPLCRRSGSATWSPIVCSGFSAVIGSWNTMPMRSPRSAHIAASSRPTSSRPFRRMLPATSAPSGSSPISASAVIDLPQPLSPIRPDGLAARDRKRDAAQRVGGAARGAQAHAQVGDFEQAQRLLEDLGRLAARDQVAVVDDHRRHRMDAELLPVALACAHLIGVGAAREHVASALSRPASPASSSSTSGAPGLRPSP